MVLVAVGDAYLRLSRLSEDDPKSLFEVFSIRNDDALLDGALRAVAMLRMKLSEDCASQVIDHVMARKAEYLRFWGLATLPGWAGRIVETFLEESLLGVR